MHNVVIHDTYVLYSTLYHGRRAAVMGISLLAFSQSLGICAEVKRFNKYDNKDRSSFNVIRI